MTSADEQRRIAALESLSRGSAVAAIAIGGAVLLGWALGVEGLKSPVPGAVTMKPNAALGFVLAGVSLLLLQGAPPDAPRGRGRGTWIAHACAATVALLGLLTLSEYLLGWHLGIDQALFREAPGAVGTSSPSRMASPTALGLLMLGSALLVLDASARPLRRLSGLLLGATTLIGAIGLTGYLYGVQAFYGIASHTTQIALHTAATLVILAIGALCARPDRGLVPTLASDGPGGVMARWLWPATIAVPVAVGWVRLQGERAGLYPSDFGLALFALSNVVVFSLLVWWNARLLDREELERRRAEREVRRLNQELEARVVERTAQLAAANRELEAFAYSVSHDLRAPLRHLDGFARLLLERDAAHADTTSLHYLETIREAATKMGRLIDDLLAFSHTGRTEPRTGRVELGRIVADVQREVARETAGRRIAWAIGPLPAVEGDPALLRVVWVNLLSNAVKFTAEREAARIEVGASGAANGEAVLFVRDNGVGFDMAYASKLFGVFQRLHRDEDFPGTGIGLATVKRIVRRHGGRIWAEAEPGRGATFYLSLALAREGGKGGDLPSAELTGEHRAGDVVPARGALEAPPRAAR